MILLAFIVKNLISSLGRIGSLILALLVVVISVGALNQSKQNKDEQALRALIKQMTAAQSRFDPATLEKIYASDYIEVSPIGDVDPREKAIGFYKPEANANKSEASPAVAVDEYQLRSYGNFAIVIARFTFAQTENQTPARPPVGFRVTLTCRKEKGAWENSIGPSNRD